MICENCGCNHDGMYGSGRFCSCKCARCFSSKAKREEINKKVSTTLKLKHKKKIKTCKICFKILSRQNQSGYCSNCVRQLPEYKEKLRHAQLQKVANGTHKGWNARNIKSYAEIFFETVLKNNHIYFEREKKVGKYFLDFVIGKLDLEIDGKQHEYDDRKKSDLERDEFLRNQGYFVYRIKWNEINSDEGKEMMEDKINLFLDFLNEFKMPDRDRTVVPLRT